jgi:hypothetical protein
MGGDEVTGGAERRHEMRTDESVGPGDENVFILKIHRGSTQCVPLCLLKIRPSIPVLKK